MLDEVRNRLDEIQAILGVTLTDEQAELASDFTKPVECLANPGTGKTMTLTIGIILAMTVHRVPGRKINAMSYTKAATAEIAARYERYCKKLGLNPTANFSTFNSICYNICKDARPTMSFKNGISSKEDIPKMAELIKELTGSDELDMYYAKRVLLAINKLNAKLKYDSNSVTESFEFKQLEIELDLFNKIRKSWFVMCLGVDCAPVGDQPIYALFFLTRSPELQEKYKNLYNIMIIDEFQDMSLLHLWILSLISKNLVVVGDMKQQIYGFNGSCSTIVDRYRIMYPEAKHCELTHSFRCNQVISNYATKIIASSYDNIEPFKGIGEDGHILFYNTKEFPLSEISSKLRIQQDAGKMDDVMFLFRNNYSAMPIVECLYKHGVTCRCNKFAMVTEIPIYRELSILIDAALDPYNTDKVTKAMRLLPEFEYSHGTLPIVDAMTRTGTSLYDVKYMFKSKETISAIQLMNKASLLVRDGALADAVYGCVFPIYSQLIIKEKWWLLEFDREFYDGLVAPIITKKSYLTMLQEEEDKRRKIQDAWNGGVGVRCYTAHSAKGLEADIIYIIDADAGVFPSDKNFSKYMKSGCDMECALELRNERHLLYVAVTRAKRDVYIVYNDKCSELLKSPLNNSYNVYDDVYKSNKDKVYDEIYAFKSLYNIK